MVSSTGFYTKEEPKYLVFVIVNVLLVAIAINCVLFFIFYINLTISDFPNSLLNPSCYIYCISFSVFVCLLCFFVLSC